MTPGVRGNGRVLAVLGLALALRVAAVIVSDYTVTPDPKDYLRHAEALADSLEFAPSTTVDGPSAYRPPGYPIFLAAVKTVAGDSVGAARIAQAMLGTLAVGLLGLVARRLWDGRIALIAMALAAVNPLLISLSVSLMSEMLLLVLVLAALLGALAVREGAGARAAAVTGVFAGLAVLTRVNAAVLLLPLVLLMWTHRPLLSRRALAAPAVAALLAVLVIAPWTLRNAMTFDAFIPVSTQAGFTLAGTYNDIARDHERWPGIWVEWFKVPEYERLAATSEDEAQAGKRVGDAALRYLRDDPGYAVDVWAHNTARVLHLESVPSFPRVDMAGNGLLTPEFADLSVAGWYALVPLALVGAFAPAARRAPAALWLIPMLAIPLFAIVSYTRFRVTIEPFLILLAALAIAHRARRPAASGVRAGPA